METRNGYSVCLFTTVLHNGKFSHNCVDYQTILADSAEEAKKLAVVDSPCKKVVSEDFTIETEQWVHSVAYLGRAVRRMVTEFIKEDD
jgi:hypothetical protein